MAKLIEEFKAFALKGNVVDMAVGVIIGGAFGKIVSSVVGDLIMPLIAAIGGVNTTDLKLVLKPAQEAVLAEDGSIVKEAVDAVTWNYGAFIQNVADFFIIAVCLFFIVKTITQLKFFDNGLRKASFLKIRHTDGLTIYMIFQNIRKIFLCKPI